MDLSISYKNIWKVAFPIIISGVAQNVVNVTDTAFLGHIGEVELGAAGNAGILYFVLIICGMGFTTGAQIIIGRRNGEGNYSSIGKVVDHSLYFMIPLAIAIFLFFQLLSPSLLKGITESESIRSEATKFLNIRSYGIFFAYIAFVFNAFFVGTTKTRVLTYSTIVMSTINIGLDYALIFGKFGLPQMGIEGAAMASVIAEACAFTFLVVYSFTMVDREKYQLFRFSSYQKDLMKRIIKIATPIMLQGFLALGSWLAFFTIIEHIGERELAISHIVRSIYMVLIIPLMGFSSATNTLVSNLIGAGRTEEVFTLVKKILMMAIGCTLVLVVFNLIIPEIILSTYTKDQALIEASKGTLLVVSGSVFFFCIANIYFNAVTGTGKTLTSMTIEAINIAVYLSSTYFIAIHLGASLEVVWCSEFIYFSVLAGMSIWYLYSRRWVGANV